MGDEADADWQDGLVEWGIEDAKQQLRDAAYRARDAAIRRGANTHPRVAEIKRKREIPRS